MVHGLATPWALRASPFGGACWDGSEIASELATQVEKFRSNWVRGESVNLVFAARNPPRSVGGGRARWQLASLPTMKGDAYVQLYGGE